MNWRAIGSATSGGLVWASPDAGRDRGFESAFLQRGVRSEPHLILGLHKKRVGAIRPELPRKLLYWGPVFRANSRLGGPGKRPARYSRGSARAAAAAPRAWRRGRPASADTV